MEHDVAGHGSAAERLEQMAAAFEAQAQRANETVAQIAEVTATATGADDLISVTVGAEGRVVDLQIEARAMRLGSQVLATEMRQVIDEAQDAYAAQVRALLSPLTGGEFQEG